MRVGYVVKRFPRASETFIGQEILGLERLGVEIEIFALRPNDLEVEHNWLSEIRAPVHEFEQRGFSGDWVGLQRRARKDEQFRQAAHSALLTAFDHPHRSGKRYLSEACWIGSMCRDLGIDHLHAHFANHPTFVAMLSHQISDIDFSFTAHAKDIYKEGPTPDLWRQQVEEASFSVTVSEANRRHLLSILGDRLNAKVHTLYNGVDLDRIQPSRPSDAQATQNVVFVSRLIEKKGADLLVEAAQVILSSHPDVRFTFAGDGEQSAALRHRVEKLQMEGNVCFTGALPHQDVIELISGANVFALPCRVATDGDRDALPTVLLEAMAAGVPCVSTPVNGVPEIILHGTTGLIVPENDARSLAGAIVQILGEPELQRSMGAAGRSRAEQRFDLKDTSARLMSLFRAAGEGKLGEVIAATPAMAGF